MTFRTAFAAAFAAVLVLCASIPIGFAPSFAQGVTTQAQSLSVVVATTANITLSGEQTIDSVAVVAGNRVLVKNQSTASQNGIYVAAAGAWARSNDFRQAGQVVQGTSVYINSGATQAGRLYTITTANPIVPGTTSLTFLPPFGADGGRNVFAADTDLSTGGCALETCVPAYPVFGAGSVFSPAAAGFGGTYGGLAPQIYLQSSAIYFTPGAPSSEDWLKDEFPAVGRHGNTIFGAGAPNYEDSAPNPPTTDGISRTTIFGSLNMTMVEESSYCEAIGQGSMRFARWCERSTAVGTATLEWLGQNLSTDPGGKYYWHPIFYNNGVPVTDGAWDAFNLETRNPGIRATIAGFSAWSASVADVVQNVAIGRDSLDSLLVGTTNTAIGYRSCALVYDGDNNTCLGYNALFRSVTGNGNTGVGREAGVNNQQGNFNTYVGFNAGSGMVGGSSNTIIGVNAGFNTGTAPATLWTGDQNICIGDSACRGYTGTVNLRLIVRGNSSVEPLIRGALDTAQILLGVGDEAPLATLHVKSANSGASPVSATGIFAEGSGDFHITIGTGTASTGSLNFADSGGSARGFVNYAHTSDTLGFGAGGVAGMYLIQGGGQLSLGVNDASPLATLHVKAGESGASPASANGIFAEGSGDFQITIATGTTNTGALNFADSGGSARGFVNYNHSTDAMGFGVSGAATMDLSSTALSATSSGAFSVTVTTGDSSTGTLNFADSGGNRGFVNYDHTTDLLGFGAGGVAGMYLMSNGSALLLGINETVPLATLHVRSADSGASPASANGIFAEGSGDFQITIATGTSNTGALNFADSGGSARGFVNYNHSIDALGFGANASNSMYIVTGGQLIKGGATSPAALVAGGFTPAVQVQGTGASASAIGHYRYSANAGGATTLFAKSRGASIGDQGVVSSGDAVMSILAQASDGTAIIEMARIDAFVDGTPGTNDMPGRITMSTTADGAATATERLRIDNAGNVIINTAAIATTATNGFLYVPTTAGTPTGVPTTYSGRAPIVVDTTNNKLYFYSGGAWRDAGP